MHTQVRTRYAPSPTGYMHIGNLRTALYEYLIAKKNNGKFVLRIEDTDQERFVEDSVDIIYSTLKMAGIKHDEGPDIGGDYGPYIQSQRKNIYIEYAKKLVEKKEAYYCFCTKERLSKLKEETDKKGALNKYDRFCLTMSEEEVAKNLSQNKTFVIRQKMPQEGCTEFEDKVYGKITVENCSLDDQILIKSDGLPTYNFANVVDDHLMKITHVVRGNEYLSSTPKYNLLYNAFGWDVPEYIHVPLILKDSGQKLSKRAGDPSFEDLISMGFLVEAVINYVALLGWSPGTTQEIFSLQELEGAFDEKGIGKSPAIFDMNKLKWMNGEYIRKLSLEDFHEMAVEYYKESIKNTNIDFMKVSSVLQQRVDVLSEIPSKVDFFDVLPDYNNEIYVHKKMKTDYEISLKSLKACISEIEKIDDWKKEIIHDTLIGLAKSMEIKNSQLLWPLRTAVSGKEVSPGGAIEIVDILGKDESIKRIKIGIERLEKLIV